jgi:hypothetical protein
MELFGKVVEKKQRLSVNGKPELVINHKSNRINLSNQLLENLGCHEGMIGFGYDPERKVGSTPAFMYILDADADGCKIGKAGAVTSKFHADRLRDEFSNELSEEANRFRLSVDTKNSVEYNGVTLYPISFAEELKNITRNRKAAHEQTDVQADVQDHVQAENTEVDEIPQNELMSHETSQSDESPNYN